MRFIGWLLSSFVLLLAAAGVGGYAALVHFSRDLPDYRQLADYAPPVTTRLHAADGTLMAEYAVENRVFVPIAAMPDHVVEAFVSAEDQNFYRHAGIDFVGIARAAVNNLRNLGTGRRPEGASTITQQVAKNFLLSGEVSYARKIREALLALRIERAYSKSRILELYLNEIYLGRNAYGVAAAALNYFDKPLSELTVGEAAYLAALPKAPNNYNPVTRHDAAVERRDYVVGRMLEDGVIDAAAADAARAEPLEASSRQATELFAADFFAEEVRRELQAMYGDAALYGGGLSVRTTLNPRYQEIADRVLRAGLIDYDRRHGWRGPVAHLDNFDGWPALLEAVARPAGAGSWQLALVLEVTDEAAEIGFADKTRGQIPLAEVEWARPALDGQRVGATPDAVGDALTLGDVVLVEALTDLPPAPPPVIVEAGHDAPAEEPPLPPYGLRQLPEISGAIVAMDPHTGRVLAVTGGYSYDMSEFNRATQAVRQPGSAFKPFVYLAALDHGYTPSTIVLDSPIAIDQGAGLELWRPSNYSEDFLGPTPLRVGIEKSRNLMTVRLIQAIGLEAVRDTARTFGVYEDMPLLYSMALGAGETTPLRLTTGYAMLVNGGRRITPSFIDRIQDRNGTTIVRHDERTCSGCLGVAWSGQEAPELPDEREQIADPVSTYQMVSMLEGVVQRGTGAALRSLGFPLAGKTGTTNDSVDSWFIGFSPDLAVGVFTGFDTPRSLGDRETGASVAVPIFGAFMGEALAGEQVPPFRIPPGVSLVRVDAATGVLAAPGVPAIWEAFRPGTEPTTASALGFTGDGQPLLPGVPAATTSGTGGLY